MNDDQILDMLHDGRPHLDAPTSDRIRARLDQHVARADSPRPAARRWRRHVGVTALGAVVLVAVVASLPALDDSNPSRDAPRTLSEAALLRAANAAGRAPWRPLASGEYFHVYTTSLPANVTPIKANPAAPTIKPNPTAKPISIERWTEGGAGPSGVASYESWYDPRGTGISLYVDGGDPTGKSKPSYYRDPKTGKVLGMGGAPLPTDTNVDASLAAARSVTVRAQPTTGRSWQRVWGQVSGGYELTHDQRDAPMPDGVPDDFSTPQFQAWFITPEQIRSLNDPNGDVDARVDQVITDAVANGMGLGSFTVPLGTFGRTTASVGQEDGVTIAVGWLGRAPLAPRARRALFEWIADRDGARLTRNVADQLGRRGTRVTFETSFDRQVPARFIDRDELVDMARGAGVPDAVRIQTNDTWNVPSHREYRRWHFSFILDEATGELLESYSGSIEHATGPRTNLPEVYRRPDTFQVTTLQASTVKGSSGSGTIFRARGRTTGIEPRSPICVSAPEVCEPGVALR